MLHTREPTTDKLIVYHWHCLCLSVCLSARPARLILFARLTLAGRYDGGGSGWGGPPTRLQQAGVCVERSLARWRPSDDACRMQRV